MAKLTMKEILEQVLEFVDQASSNGIRYSEIQHKIQEAYPGTSPNSIQNRVHYLKAKGEVVTPSRGLYVLKKFADDDSIDIGPTKDKSTETGEPKEATGEPKESAYYEPFANWLKGQEEVGHATVLGGNAVGGKWATPDVIGTDKPTANDPVEFQLELVSAEIKSDGSQSIIAFGQACAYRLFSHKTYIVMPSDIVKNDLDRLDALCSLYGIGLVLFDGKPEAASFTVKVKARRLEPDTFYMNEFARRIRAIDTEQFNKLFGS